MTPSRPATKKGQRLRGKQPRCLHLVLLIMGLLILGAFFTCLNGMDEALSTENNHAKSTFYKTEYVATEFTKKIRSWLPKDHEDLLGLSSDSEPDWHKEFWTPIDLEMDSDPLLTMCKLNFKEYSANPHLYAMFRDFVAVSRCSGSRRKKERLSVLMDELNARQQNGLPEGRVVKPSGFIFHESRVGSTLVANSFASDPWSLVFSESSPIANAVNHCPHCTKEKQIQVLRDVVALMGNSPFHRNLFFKMQSILSTKMELVLEAFPDVPFGYIYRKSIQTMMSHLDPKKGTNNAPCLRSMRSPPKALQESIGKLDIGGTVPREAWCASHLNMLMQSALSAYHKYGVTHDDEGHIKQRGIFINYEALPGILPRVVLPMFGVEVSQKWLSKMQSESKQYSKGHGESTTFQSDSADKDDRATENIKLYSKMILDPAYDEMVKFGAQGLQSANPEQFKRISWESGSDNLDKLDWKSLKSIPNIDTIPDVVDEKDESNSNLRGHSEGHSHALKEKDFYSWSPFSNKHDSKSFSPAESCGPLQEGVEYPKAFSMVDILKNWNPDNTDIPPQHYDTLCHFDYQDPKQLKLAYEYRGAELPFIVYNIPELDAVVKKWNDFDYLSHRLGNKKYRTELSKDNHFMYWRNSNTGKAKSTGWTPPTSFTAESFENWMEIAVKGQNTTLDDRSHHYFRVSSDSGNEWLFNELPFFKPEKNIFMVEPKEQRGIHCRFGMRSVIAEAHFDGSRNSVVEIGGLRRWILAHPSQCKNMHMLPNSHPSGRHSEVDWSNADLEKFPNFARVVGSEVILQPGDFLYVPTYWIHYIVSLNVNFQCNTRSGKEVSRQKELDECGF